MSNPKELRKQLKNVVQDLAPKMIQDEVFASLQKEIQERLNEVAEEVRGTLKKIDERAKDVQSLIMRQIGEALAPRPVPPQEMQQEQQQKAE